MTSPSVVLVGSVTSSLRTLEGLIRHGLKVVGVLGLAESAARRVSGYASLADVARGADIPFAEFTRVNEPHVHERIRAWAPDLLFVVGLSQLLDAASLALPRLGSVGFHPTRLPRGRGRAPVAWLILDPEHTGGGAATFFQLEEAPDSGPILSQEPFEILPDDSAAEVMARMEDAIDRALDRWLPLLAAGVWEATPQDSSVATWTGARRPADGRLDWSRPAADLSRLTRACGRPHPGAYTYFAGEKLIVWRTRAEPSLPIRGALGRVVERREDGACLVQTGAGLLWLEEFEWARPGPADPEPKVGQRLGYVVEDSVHSLRRRVALLEDRLAAIETKLGDS